MQTKFTKPNHVYRINGNLDLDGSSLTIPSNSILDFSGGGKMTNGTVVLDNTLILPNCCDISRYITANMLGSYKSGQVLYDPNKGKMKLWNGSAWVNLDGTSLT